MTVTAVGVRTGLEALIEDGLPTLAGKRVGLVANHTAVDQRLRTAIDLLHASSHLRLTALFGPEHGVRGDAQAGVPVENATDQRTGLPVYSLYGRGQTPQPDMLRDLDALVFDIQDVGCRYATYISTLLHVQEAAAEAGLPVVVLDRPNPLGGQRVEGNLVEAGFTSFVGVHPIAIRHGLTVGELARLFATERGWPAPEVVPMRGWRREQWFDQTGLPWVQPSPNLPTLDAVTLYPGTCLLEGTNVSEGRGTTRPFELLGAPWIDPFALADTLERRGLPGVAFRPTSFMPTFSKHQGEVCGGVQVHLVDRERLRPVELGVHLVRALRTLNPDAFAWREGRGTYFLDRLLGSDAPRRALDAGAEAEQVLAGWPQQASAFEERRQSVLLY